MKFASEAPRAEYAGVKRANLQRGLPPMRAASRAGVCLWFALWIGSALVSPAQSIMTWTDGTGNSNWNNAANWISGIPGTTDVAQFSASTAKTPNISANASLGGLVFTGTSDAESFTGSRTLTLNGAGGLGIDNQTGLVQTFGSRFALGASQIWQSTANGGGLIFNGTVDLAGSNLTLALASSGSSTITLAGNVSGTGSSLTVGGNGTAILAATGSYTGATTINSGATLRISGGSLSSSTDMIVNAGGTYDMNGVGGTLSTIAGAGNLHLGSATLTTAGNGSTTFSGVISDGGAGGSLDKRGSGTLTLFGANTFTGGVLLNVGSIEVGHDSALGTGTLNLSGGTLTAAADRTLANNLAMSGSSAIAAGPGVNFVFASDTISPATGILTLDNTANGGTHMTVGFSGSGGSFVFNRPIAFDDAATDLRFLNTTGVQTLSGVISGPGNLVRNGAGGTTVLSANNSFTGSITLKAGTLQVSADNRLGGAPGSPTPDKLVFDGGVLNTTSSFTLNSNRGITLNSGGGTFSPDSGTTLTYGGIVAGAGGLTLAGAGSLVLTGASTFSGKTSIASGTVSVSSVNSVGGGSPSSNLGAPTTVANGTIDLGSGSRTGTLAINSSTFQITDRVINLAGTSGGGTIDSSGAGGIAFTSDLAATGMGTKTFSLQGSGTGNAFGGAILDGAGTTTLLKDGTGTWTLNGSGSNTHTGLTTVNAGTLVLAKTGGATAITGDLAIGDGAGTDALQLGGSNQISDTATVTLAGSGVLDVNGNTETIGGLAAASSAAQVQLGGGSLTVANSSANSYAGSLAGSGSFTKTGAGSLVLSGSSGSFSGATSVNAGVVTLQSGGALGTSAVTVGSGANLEVQGGITVANAISLAGSGTGAIDGALENTAGVNTVSGPITLVADTRINSSAGTLNITGTVGGSGQTLTFGGGGDISVTGVIATGGGGLVKDGSGTLRLGAAGGNTFAGATVLNAGAIVADASNVFNNSAALTLGAGTQLSLNNLSETIGNLNGSGTLDLGTSGAGILTLTAGNGTFSGAFTGSGTIIIGAGATLTLGADFNAPNLNFTLAGGTLALNGTTLTFGTLHITGNSILDFGNTSATFLTVNNLTFQNTGLQLTIQNWSSLSDGFYALNFTGAVPDTSGFSPQNQVSFTGFSANTTVWQSFDRQIRPTPEPPTYGLIFMSLSLGLVGLRRRARRLAA